MPRPTRAELEVENSELLDRLEKIRDEVTDLFDSDEDDENEQSDGAE